MNKKEIMFYLKKLRTPFFILAIVLSVVGSYQVYSGRFSNIYKEIIVIIISTFKLFAFSPTNGITNEAPLAYELAIWMAPATTMVGFFSIFKKIYNSIRLNILHLGKDHLVVMGNNEDAITFIKNLKRDYPDQRVMCLIDEGADPKEDRLKDLDVKIVKLDYSNTNPEINKFIIEDERIGDFGKIVCFEDEPENFGYITTLNSLFQERKEKISLFVSTESYRLKEMVELKMDELKNFDIHYFNINDLLVMKLMNDEDFDFNITKVLKEDWSDKKFSSIEELSNQIGRVNLLIIGFSKIGEHFLTQASNNGTINSLLDMKVTIIDPNATSRFDRYNDYKTMIDKVMEYELIDLKSGSRNLASIVNRVHREEEFTAVSFCNDELYENIINLDRVVDILGNTPIGIYSEKFIEIDTILESLCHRHENIKVFGDGAEVLTKDIIIDEELIKGAKEFNAYYNKVAGELMGWGDSEESVEEQWSKLSNIKKESSIYQTMHQNVKKILLEKLSQMKDLPDTAEDILENFREKTSDKTVSEQVDIIEKDLFMNFLTSLEHKRWNNFYYMRDFTFSEVKDESRKTHDCLIDNWDEFLGGIQRDKAIYDYLSVLSVK